VRPRASITRRRTEQDRAAHLPVHPFAFSSSDLALLPDFPSRVVPQTTESGTKSFATGDHARGMSIDEYDVVVAGAGTAGCYAAATIGERGLTSSSSSGRTREEAITPAATR